MEEGIEGGREEGKEGEKKLSSYHTIEKNSYSTEMSNLADSAVLQINRNILMQSMWQEKYFVKNF